MSWSPHLQVLPRRPLEELGSVCPKLRGGGTRTKDQQAMQKGQFPAEVCLCLQAGPRQLPHPTLPWGPGASLWLEGHRDAAPPS